MAGSSQPLQNLVTGILATDRGQGVRVRVLLYPETMARNTVYLIEPNEPRYINELIAVPIDPSDFIGGAGWTAGYQIARASNQLLTGDHAHCGAGRAIKTAVRGLVQTIKALDYVRNSELRDSLGSSDSEQRSGGDRSVADEGGACSRTLGAVLDSGYANLTAAVSTRRCRSRCRAATRRTATTRRRRISRCSTADSRAKWR